MLANSENEAVGSEHRSTSDENDEFEAYETPSIQPELPAETSKHQPFQDAHPIWAISKEEVELLDDELGKGAWDPFHTAVRTSIIHLVYTIVGVVMWELWSGAQTPYLDLYNQEVKGKVNST